MQQHIAAAKGMTAAFNDQPYRTPKVHQNPHHRHATSTLEIIAATLHPAG